MAPRGGDADQRDRHAREHLEAFLAALTDRLSPATVAKHYRSLHQLFRWLVEDGEITYSPMERMRPPAASEQPVDILTDDEVRALLDAARGNTFENRRDTAMLRMLIDTGMRAGELAGLAVTDLDSEQSVAIVMGEGRRGRAVPYGTQTADALRRYLRAGALHPQAAPEALWLGKKGRVTNSGVRQMLERRATEAGVSNVHHGSAEPAAGCFTVVTGTHDGPILVCWSAVRDSVPEYRLVVGRVGLEPTTHGL